MSIRTLIVDDEPLARERIRQLVDSTPGFATLSECANGREAVDAIATQKPDLVFLDIQMPDLDGFGVIREVGVQEMPPVIFVTAFDQFAVRAFESSALDYLLKPIDRIRFDSAMNRAREACRARQDDGIDQKVEKLLELAAARQRQDERLIVRAAGSVHFLRMDEVDWVEAARNYIKIHCGGTVHTLRETMGNIEERLDPQRFLRIHRSTLVNFDRIRKIEPGLGSEHVAVLHDGTKLPISRAYRRGKIKEFLH